MNELYDLEHKAYISFSGGKDSTVLSALFDLALPGNQIPRVYINTGIDYRAIVDFVKEYGKREGAGRPKGTTKENKKVYKTFSVSCLEHELALIKSNAEKQGKTPSRYLVDLALKDDN